MSQKNNIINQTKEIPLHFKVNPRSQHELQNSDMLGMQSKMEKREVKSHLSPEVDLRKIRTREHAKLLLTACGQKNTDSSDH